MIQERNFEQECKEPGWDGINSVRCDRTWSAVRFSDRSSKVEC